jgi:hypothetical protein
MDDEQDLQDIHTEESSRGRRRPQKAEALARERKIRAIARLLADPKCTKERFLETLRAFGIKDESEEFWKLVTLWRQRHGGG